MTDRVSTSTNPTKPEVAGEGAGGISGAALGATIGTVAGPLGSIIGGLAGAAGGWWAGRHAADAATHTVREDEVYREDYTKRGFKTDYDRVRPAYQVGHVAALNPEYSGKKFDDISPALEKSWTAASSKEKLPAWAEAQDSARYSYDRARDREVSSTTSMRGNTGPGDSTMSASPSGTKKSASSSS